MKNVELLRYLAKGFIWVGAVACAVYLLLALPSVGSFSGFLLTVADVVGRLSATVGLGSVLLALSEIADELAALRRAKERSEIQQP